MFSLLYNTVFPWLGKFFGQLAAIAGSSTDLVFRHIFGVGDKPLIRFTNVFTGETGYILGMPVSDVLSVIAQSTIGNYIDLLGIRSLPFWLGLLIMFSSIFMFVISFKFMWKFIKSTFL